MSIDGEGYVYIDANQGPVGGLPAALEALPRTGEGPDITLRADRSLDYGRVMAVMGELNRAGFTSIQMVGSSSAAPPAVIDGSATEQ